MIWSVTAFVVEIPSGAWADAFSRRRLLIVAPLLSGAGYALWTWAPSYPAFALGFVLWGTQGALVSGALQALVYDGLAAADATDRYAAVTGRARALGTTAQLAANALAAPAFIAGGYLALGAASVAACLAMAAVGASFTEVRQRPPRSMDAGAWSAYIETLTAGFDEVRRRRPVRRALVLAGVIYGFQAVDEYLPLLAAETVRTTAGVAILVTLVTVGLVAGAAYAGRAARWPMSRLGAGVVIAAAALALGAASGHAAGFVLIAIAFAILEISAVVTDTRLQNTISGSARATVTSLSGFGAEIAAIMVFATYAAGSTIAGPGPLIAFLALPLLLIGLVLVARWRSRLRGRSL